MYDELGVAIDVANFYGYAGAADSDEMEGVDECDDPGAGALYRGV